MSTIGTFFRHCPACGKRFELRLVSKKEVSGEGSHQEVEEKQVVPRPIVAMKGATEMVGLPAVLTVEAPELDQTKEFDMTYKCKHCGHEWTEERLVFKKGTVKGAYTGD